MNHVPQSVKWTLEAIASRPEWQRGAKPIVLPQLPAPNANEAPKSSTAELNTYDPPAPWKLGEEIYRECLKKGIRLMLSPRTGLKWTATTSDAKNADKIMLLLVSTNFQRVIDYLKSREENRT